MIYGCLQPRELWFIDFNHVHVPVVISLPQCIHVQMHMYMYMHNVLL